MSTVACYWAKPTPGHDAKLTPEDIIEMQTIDADCNDCRHLQRGAMRKAPGLTTFDGHCGKFNRATTAHPMQFTGMACFEHRKAKAAALECFPK